MNITIRNDYGAEEELMTRNSFYNELESNFDCVFENYLFNRLKITIQEFEEIIKEKYPEKFI